MVVVISSVVFGETISPAEELRNRATPLVEYGNRSLPLVAGARETESALR
jgi:hypothetical protein